MRLTGFVGNTSLKFLQASGKRSLHLIEMSDHL